MSAQAAFPEGADGHPGAVLPAVAPRARTRTCRFPRTWRWTRRVAGLALMLHAGVIGGGDLEGGVPAICPFAAATTVCEPLTSPADRLSSGPLHMRAMSLSTR
jgi:anti-sigma factor RsiW